jgi:hypothetical protein
MEEETDQSWGGATRKRRTSYWLGAEIGEVMHSQKRSGGNSLRRSSVTQGCITNRWSRFHTQVYIYLYFTFHTRYSSDVSEFGFILVRPKSKIWEGYVSFLSFQSCIRVMLFTFFNFWDGIRGKIHDICGSHSAIDEDSSLEGYVALSTGK